MSVAGVLPRGRRDNRTGRRRRPPPFHADFLSGHLELARATGAEIGSGARAVPEFTARALHDGEGITLGDVTLEILETPGHTPESISIVVYEHVGDEVPYGVLTGDTLFIDPTRPTVVFCAGGYRSSIAASLLRREGFADVSDVLGGYQAWASLGGSVAAA